jgi:serine/threonine protein kinase
MLDGDFNLKVIDYGFASTEVSNQTRIGTPEYMAPEIAKGRIYSGAATDLFAAGTILFIMVAGHQPFLFPLPDDEHYKTIHSNRPDFFWKLHSKTKAEGESFFSPAFKDLVTHLLQYNPKHRLSIAEIMTHEWYLGSKPSQEEIFEEFAKRQEYLRDQNMDVDGDADDIDVDPSVFESHTVHRGIGGTGEKSIISERRENTYNPKVKKNTQFFSTSNIDVLFRNLAGFAQKAATNFNFADGDYSVEMTMQEGEQIAVTFTVKILKVEGEDKHCVQAIKNVGNRFAFSEAYKQLKVFFGGHANTTF